MDIERSIQVLADVLALMESKEMRQLAADVGADLGVIPPAAKPPPPPNAAPLAFDPGSPAGSTIPPRAVRE